MLSDQSLHGFLLLAPVFIVSLTLHELAHALVAYRLGDRTAKEMGRLTLNPIAHMDPLGSLILVVTYFGGSFLFGWAKPVPVDPRNLRTSPQVGMALVGAAGPASNFVIALIAGAVWAHNELTGDTAKIVAYTITVNVILGVFNLFPIPPLDGSRVIGGFMPRDVYARWAALDQYGMFAVFGLFFLFNNQTSTLLESGFEKVLRVISAIVGGHPLI
ncbi:MAG TPA: site-2 protease family protein [Gaiellales bacterium]|jgi:Zn-dependent protease|nr:site-2 protease family protein [Gaiellales bacterium]